LIKVAALALTLLGLLPAMAAAQEDDQPVLSGGGSMGQLLSEGYEIKAAVQNGKSFVVFLQKDSTGYACQMTTLSRSVCGKIN
jgi:hypothetical protein